MNTLSRRHLVTVAVAALAVAAFVATNLAHAASEPAFRAAFDRFSSASAGDDGAVDPAASAFDALLEAEPGNPLLLAYAGASTALKAKATVMPWKKMGYAEDGLARIDKALALLRPVHDAPMQRGVPGSLEVKFVAANTFLAVPDFMNRGARGSRLLNEVLDSPLFGAAPLGFRGPVWMRAAALAEKEHRPADARRWLNEAIVQGTPQADAARARLKGLAA